MRIAVTGGTGLVGRFIVNEALAAGDQVTVMTRNPPAPGFFAAEVTHLPYDLSGDVPEIAGFDAIVHAAFDHVPGRYRGGEGDDPEGFMARNRDGSIGLFAASVRAGAHVVFISSRAVYGPQSGVLTEGMRCQPDTLYGQAKLAAERALISLDGRATILRATGVYGAPGPGQRHKWADLFEDFAAGKTIAPRAGTEIHGSDLAAAVRLGLNGGEGVFNVSDLMLDRRELLAIWQDLTGCPGLLPAPARAHGHNSMQCGRLRGLGWQPSGWPGLRHTLRQMAAMAGILPKDI